MSDNLWMQRRDSGVVVPDLPSEKYWGLAVAPWSPDEVYAVCADWADGACPVYALQDGRWVPTPRQVATYRHGPRTALVEALREAIVASEGLPADHYEAWDQAERLAVGAIDIGR